MIPVTIVTGFLGSGKTSLLNHILASRPGARIAVLENEFGEIAIDSELISAVREDVIELINGCVCCGVRGDLSAAFETLAERADRGERFERVLIETTGLADPGPVIQVFLMEGAAKRCFRLDAVLCVADARRLIDGTGDSGESKAQIVHADVLIVNKTDLTEGAELDGFERWLRAMNPGARILRARHARVPVDEILDQEAFDYERASRAEGAADVHDGTVESAGFRAEGELDRERFASWIAGTLSSYGPNLLRVKGVLAFSKAPERWLFDAVGMMNGLKPGKPWSADAAGSKIVFIGRGLDRAALEKGFFECRR